MLNSIFSKRILEAIVGRDDLFGSRVYLGLSSTAPNHDGTNITEPSGGGYGRVLVGLNGTSETYKFGSASADGKSISNSSEIYFPESTGSWGPALTHFVFYNSATAKDAASVIAYGPLTDEGEPTPVTVSAEKTVVMFRPGKLVVAFTD
jgi:hypothetical protein